MHHTIPKAKKKAIYELVLKGPINLHAASRALGVSRKSIRFYQEAFKILMLQYPAHAKNFNYLNRKFIIPEPTRRKLQLLQPMLPGIALQLQQPQTSIHAVWKKYRLVEPKGLHYTQFSIHVRKYCGKNKLSAKHKRIPPICAADKIVLRKWRKSPLRKEWERAVILFSAQEGKSLRSIGRQIERSDHTVQAVINTYTSSGLAGFDPLPRNKNQKITGRVELKKKNLMSLLHESPSLHGINRSAWSLTALGIAYKKKYNLGICNSTISEYVREAGYSFRKARCKLTSPDPLFREKLDSIKKILSTLAANELFFSIDEFGPFAIRPKGGISLIKDNQLRQYPQFAKSKGFLICTAALELSTNQVTHFYSLKKNTAEMIKLIDLLVTSHPAAKKLYFSWDAASWHSSKEITAKIRHMNSKAYRKKYGTPQLALAPLPSSAQFLNVIESVFSGLAKAVLHNSDYRSVGECKTAIDRHFSQRNEHYRLYPGRAGKTIWGKEKVTPVFNESNNCKNANWR